MEVKGYCNKCDLEFSKEIKSMDDLKRVICPKCGSVSVGKKNRNVSNVEENVGKIAYFFINFYFYFYLIFSCFCLVSFYLGINKLFLFSFVIMVSFYVIELFLGYTRNLFGIVGIVVGGVVGYLFLGSAFIGIVYVFFLSSIIKVFINFIINVIIRRCR